MKSSDGLGLEDQYNSGHRNMYNSGHHYRNVSTHHVLGSSSDLLYSLSQTLLAARAVHCKYTCDSMSNRHSVSENA